MRGGNSGLTADAMSGSRTVPCSLFALHPCMRRISWLGRRGSPCILPEETLEGYKLAIDAGVDFIEMDAVSVRLWLIPACCQTSIASMTI